MMTDAFANSIDELIDLVEKWMFCICMPLVVLSQFFYGVQSSALGVSFPSMVSSFAVFICLSEKLCSISA